jgi:acylglycerol lipase
VLSISHGLCDHAGRYAGVADRLAQEGIAVYGLDHRGHGWSHGARANIGRMALAAADLDRFLALVAGRHPGASHFLAGHSMGCVIALECVLAHSPTLSGLALCAPTMDVSAAPGHVLRAAKVLSAIAPRLGVIAVYGRDSGDPAEDAADDDPLIHRGKAPARTIAEILSSVHNLPHRLHRIRMPLMLQHGSADQLVPKVASEFVYAIAGSPDKRLELYEGLGHALLTAPGGDPVRSDLAAWILTRE